MILPQTAIIAPEKLTHYLLVKRAVGDKSEFLKRAGYHAANWHRLAQDLRDQVLPKEALRLEQTAYGDVFEIRVPLTGPNGVRLDVRTIWMIEAQSGLTKFITLYPDKRSTP